MLFRTSGRVTGETRFFAMLNVSLSLVRSFNFYLLFK